MMSLRQRVFSILQGKVPDKLPWYADLSYWHFAMDRKGCLEKRYKGFEGILNLHKDLGVGFYLQGYEPYMPEYKNCEVSEVERSVGGYEDFTPIYKGSKVIKSEDNNDIVREVSTPIGKIKERWKWVAKSFTWAPTEYFINTVEDLKVFKYWMENTNYKPDYHQANMVKAMVGEQGCVLCYQPRSPLTQLMILFAGVTNTVYLMMDSRKSFDETIKVLQHKSDEAAEIALNSPAEFIMIPENLSSDIVGKRFFEEFLRPYEEKWNKKIKSKGKYSFIHMDGYLKGLLKEVSTTGFSVIEAMTPKPVGDIEVNEFSNYVENDVVMWGGIPGASFTPLVSDEVFEKFVLEVIKIMVSEPRYVLGLADQIPPDGIIERVKTVSDLVEKYGFYGKNCQ